MISSPDVFALMIAMIGASLALIALHVLRERPSYMLLSEQRNAESGRRLKLLLLLQVAFGIAVGLVLTVLATREALEFLGVERMHVGSLLIANAVKRTDPTRKQIVLVGTSQTAQGIDDVLLERLLGKSSLDYQVIQLALPALFNVEGDFLLEQYIEHTPHLPTAIFIDIGFDSEYLPVIGIRRGPFEVSSGDWSHTWLRINRARLRYWENLKAAGIGHPIVALTDVTSLLSEVADSFNFFICNATNCGILRQLDPAAPSQYPVGRQLLFGHARNFNQSLVMPPEALACRFASQKMSTDFLEPSLSLRRWQTEKYSRLGVPIIGFYYPPNLTPRTACFQKEFCERIGPYPCLTMDDTSLLANLNSYDQWYDQFHVNDHGVPIFTAALARDIVRVLSPPKSIH